MKNYGKKCEEVFKDQLDLIKEQSIRDLVVECFDKLCPDYFWDVPASTSGLYHPDFALGKGGLVRHVKAAVWWGIELAKSMDSENGENDTPHKDIIIAALLLHDIIKNGETLADKQKPGNKITQTHGVSASHRIFEDILNKKANKTQMLIIYAVQGHMGVWTFPHEYRPTNIPLPLAQHIAQIVHLADYCASRKTIDMIRFIGLKKNGK